MALQPDPDGLAAHPRDQLPLHRLGGHQADRPPRRPRGGIAADHRDDPLLLGRREHRRRPGARPLVQRAGQPPGAVSLGDVANRLRRQSDDPGDVRGAGASPQLQQGQRADNHPHLLHTAAQQRA